MAVNIDEAIAARGPDFQIGTDVDRHWATGAQAFMNSDNTMIVFREHNILPGQDGELKPALKNVVSVVMPTVLLREFHGRLASAFEALDAESASK